MLFIRFALFHFQLFLFSKFFLKLFVRFVDPLERPFHILEDICVNLIVILFGNEVCGVERVRKSFVILVKALVDEFVFVVVNHDFLPRLT